MNQHVFNFEISHQGGRQGIVFDSDFDSGNIAHIQRLAENAFFINVGHDCHGRQSRAKSWFHFAVKQMVIGLPIRLSIGNLHMLASVAKFSECYKPVCRLQNGQWHRFSGNSLITMTQECTVLHLQFTPQQSTIYLAFTYPFSYKDNQKFYSALQKLQHDRDFYYCNQVLTKSNQERNVRLITISSHQGKIGKDNFKVHSGQSIRFRSNKKVILVSARVHPGETPSSYCMMGLIKFLTNKKDSRAILLRKYFVFKLVPMLNPDGVYHGHYRMDVLNQNLNRHYNSPDPERQPACFAMVELVKNLSEEKRLLFYIDLHSHAGRKNNFIYGNAVQQFVGQVQTQLFCKLLSLNNPTFDYQSCNFSKKQMTSKDRNQDFSKEGCGRVVFHKSAGLIYSYTLQLGYHSPTSLNDLPYPTNIHRRFQRGAYQQQQCQNPKSQFYKRGIPYFCPAIYQSIGKAVLVSILDLFQLNPFSRVSNSLFKSLQGVRKEIAVQLSKTQRFKKQERIMNRVKHIQELAYQLYHESLLNEGAFVVSQKTTSHYRRNLNEVSRQRKIIPSLRSLARNKLQKQQNPKFSRLKRLPRRSGLYS